MFSMQATPERSHIVRCISECRSEDFSYSKDKLHSDSRTKKYSRLVLHHDVVNVDRACSSSMWRFGSHVQYIGLRLPVRESQRRRCTSHSPPKQLRAPVGYRKGVRYWITLLLTLLALATTAYRSHTSAIDLGSSCEASPTWMLPGSAKRRQTRHHPPPKAAR